MDGKNRQTNLSKYNIKFAHSFDGINWIRKGKISVDYENKSEHALAKPSVIKVGKKA